MIGYLHFEEMSSTPAIQWADALAAGEARARIGRDRERGVTVPVDRLLRLEFHSTRKL